MGTIEVTQRDREAAEPFRQGKGGRYDRDVERLAAAFARHRQPDAGDVERVLQQVLDAIDTGRNEPLMIVRDTVRNFMEDRRAAKGGQSDV